MSTGVLFLQYLQHLRSDIVQGKGNISQAVSAYYCFWLRLKSVTRVEAVVYADPLENWWACNQHIETRHE